LDVARLNFSHGTPDEHERRAALIREMSRKHGRYVAIMGDLQGPKIRISRFIDGKVSLKAGANFTLSITHPKDAGTESIVGIDCPALSRDWAPGDELLLDDGRLVLGVETVTDEEVSTSVIIGGELSDHKGINRRGGGLSAPSLTDKDHSDIRLAARLGAD